MLFAIVDIETTGGHASANGITEVAIVVHDGHEVLHCYETLINPLAPIPYHIQNLTGITNEMVATAPHFTEVAATIFDLLRDKVFVAHNVNFDYSFLRHQLQLAGYKLDVKKLCTVRLARKIIPGHKRYGLGSICGVLGIEHTEKHRAMGDCAATTELFALLYRTDFKNEMASMLKGRNSEQYLPPNLPVESLAQLPECPGVYYFYNASGKVIYVGKAINLQRRVRSHFSNNKTSRQKADFLREIHSIDHRCTPTDLMAQILESVEIRKLWPAYNRSQKGHHPLYGVVHYTDRNGYERLAVEKLRPGTAAVYSFNSLFEGQQWLQRLQSEFELCPRLCNLAAEADCAGGKKSLLCPAVCGTTQSPDAYNDKVCEALRWIDTTLPTFLLLSPQRNAEECPAILVQKGKFYGMGTVCTESDILDLDSARSQLEPMPDNDFIRSIIYKEAGEKPHNCLHWNENLRQFSKFKVNLEEETLLEF